MSEQPNIRIVLPDAASTEPYVDPLSLRVEELYAKANYNLAFAKLLDLLDSMQDQRNYLANLQGQLSNVTHTSTIEGTISFDEESRNVNRIANGFQQCLREIKQNIGRNLKIMDFPVLSRKITDQAEVLKIVTEELLAGRYENLETIPGGNSGLFFRATSKNTGQLVVLKVLRIMNIDDLPKKQIELALKLKHRNIIRILDHNFEQLPAFVILEYINGIKLDEAIRTFKGFSLDEALHVARELTSALDYIRKRGIRHANIRPSKIYIDDEGLPMISSLDIIKHEKDELLSLGRFKEECRYLSPEALDETLDQDDLEAVEQSDLFSLGLILLEMLTAQSLFCGDTVKAIFEDRNDFFLHPNQRLNDLLATRPQLKPLIKILKKMLAETPEDRFAYLTDALKELKEIRDSASVDCLAKASYNLVRVRQHDLIDNFYKRFFSALPLDVRAGIQYAFKNPEKQGMMLRKSIEVILDIDSPEKEQAFLGILDRPVHANYSAPEYYEIFLYTLRDTIIDLYPGSLHNKSELLKAWDAKVQQCLRLIQGHLQKRKAEAATSYLSTDTTVG